MAKKQKKVGIDQIHMQNAVKTLAANIRFASVDDPIRSIVITSSVPNEGKTTVAITLADAIASSGSSVLLIECDMRRRSIANNLGIHARSGVYSVLCGQVGLADAMVATGTRGMYFLDSEPHIPNPDVLLSSKRFRKMVDAALDSFDYVIFDTPPLSAFVDAAVLSTIADGTLLVVGQDVVRRDELAASHAQLEKAGANLIGAVMNLCKSEKSEYYTEYYSRGGDDSNAPSAPAAAPVAKPAANAAAPHSTARKASRPAAAPRQAAPRTSPAQQASSAARGLKPIPQAAAKIAPDTTAQFIASAHPDSKR